MLLKIILIWIIYRSAMATTSVSPVECFYCFQRIKLIYFFFAITAAGVVSCGSPKSSTRTSSIVQIIFLFRSFEISGDMQSVQNMGGSREGGGGQGVRTPPPPPWNCQIINFCHAEIFRQTPSGTLDLP